MESDQQFKEKVRAHLERHYGFSEAMEGRLRRAEQEIGDSGKLRSLDEYIERCIANRAEPRVEHQPFEQTLTIEQFMQEITAAPPAEERYVNYHLVKRVTPLRLDAVADAARPDNSIDFDTLFDALCEYEGADRNSKEELRNVLGPQPTVDTAARALVDTSVDFSQQNRLCTDYNCCFWGWECSWGCLLICCSI